MRARVIAKALIASLTALGTWGGTALADDHVTGVEWFGLTGVVVAGLAVYATKNAAPLRDEGR